MAVFIMEVLFLKIAVLSDIHGNAAALKSVLERIKSDGISKLIILGDVVLKGPMPAESLRLLRNDEFEILAWIKGNTDLWFWEEVALDNEPYFRYAKAALCDEELSFIKALPERSSLNICAYSILCVHGTPKSIVQAIDGSVSKEYIEDSISGVNEDIILCGHSHEAYIGEVQGKKIFNAGSVGNPLDGDNRASYGIIDFDGSEVKLLNMRLEYDFEEIIEAAKERSFPNAESYEKVIKKGA